MANQVTKIADLINPEVLSGMVSAKLEKKIRFKQIAAVDSTLTGNPGNTITYPAFEYSGDAREYNEGETCELDKITTSTKQFTIKKAMKAIPVTDEALLSGYGDILGECSGQIALAIANKIDNDVVEAILSADKVSFDGSATKIAYSGIVDAIDLFGEEVNSEKIMFINSHQLPELRKADDFISSDKYGTDNKVMISGEVGRICNTRIIVSNKVPSFDSYYVMDEVSGTAVTSANLEEVKKTLPNVQIGEKVTKVNKAVYFNPIIKMNNDVETEDQKSAITIFLKRNTLMETDRDILNETTVLKGGIHYGVGVTNATNIVIAHFKK
ncbi:MAG: N4-gp56 family major capsid protein [Clostridium butyricum]|nr:N4-gp56 family major capsid protein [Clostridium butyricum]